MKFNKGISLVEMMFSLIIICLIIITIAPAMTLRRTIQNYDASSIACIKSDLGNTAAASCIQSINNCKYSQNNACDTLTFYADHGNLSPNNEQTAAKGVLKAVCDAGGEEACRYFITSCQKDSASCDIGGNDLSYYLNILPSDSLAGRTAIQYLTMPYYNLQYSNIKTLVDNLCCPTVNTACAVKGVTLCPPPQKTIGSTANTINHSVIPWNLYDDIGYASVISNNNIFITGGQLSNSTNYSGVGGSIDIPFIKLDNTGHILSQTGLYLNVAAINSDEVINSIAVDSTNSYFYLAGYTYNSLNKKMLIIKTDSSGTPLWTRTIDHVLTTGFANGITVDAGDNSYVAGAIPASNFSPYYQMVIVKFRSDGATAWVDLFGSGTSKHDKAKNIVMNGASNVLVIGDQTSNSTSGQSVQLLNLAASNGSLNWQKEITGSSGKLSSGWAITVDSGNNIYITGSTQRAAGSQDSIFVIKLNSSGTLIWGKNFYNNNDSYSTGRSIAVDGSNNVYIGGYATSAGNTDAIVLKLDSSGNVLWQKRIGGTGDDRVYGISLDSSNNLYAVGTQSSITSSPAFGAHDIYWFSIPAGAQTSTGNLSNETTALSIGSKTLPTSSNAFTTPSTELWLLQSSKTLDINTINLNGL